MKDADRYGLILLVLSLGISLLSFGTSIKSCSIAEEQSKRYFEQIKFTSEVKNNTLTVIQTSGNKYFLTEVGLIPKYSIGNTPFSIGKVKYINLSAFYSTEQDGYVVPNIKEEICITQVIPKCEKLAIIEMDINYTINKKKITNKVNLLHTGG